MICLARRCLRCPAEAALLVGPVIILNKKGVLCRKN